MRFLRAALVALAIVAPTPLWAQATVLQGGPWTPGHMPQYVGQGGSQPVIQDGGSAGGESAIGGNPSELGLTARGTGSPPFAGQGNGPLGTNLCDYDAPITNPTGFHFLCWSPNIGGHSVLAVGAGGVAPQIPLEFNVNGTIYPFPFTFTGILGPPASTVGDIAIWQNTTGTLLADSGYKISQLQPTVPTTVALKALGAGTYTSVLREGYYQSGDSPSATYIWSPSVCALNAGLGDGGSQIPPTIGTGCWLIAPTDRFNVRVFGAKGDASTNDTIALQNTVNAALAAGVAHNSSANTVYFPGGSYVITSALSANGPLTMQGDNPATSVLIPPVSSSAITVASQAGVVIEKLGVTYTSLANSGVTAIALTGVGANSNASSVIRDVLVNNSYNCLGLHNTVLFVVDDAKCYGFNGVGATVDNPNNVDVGDSVITNSTFFSNFSGPGGIAGIQWLSSGGLRIVNNKIATTSYGVLFQLVSGAVTAQIIISNNSFDTVGLVGVSLSRLGSTGNFNSVSISNNMFASSLIAVNVPQDPVGPWLTSLNINGNTYIGMNNPGCIAFEINSTEAFAISNNTLFANNSSSVAISTGPTADSAVIGPNIKAGIWAANFIGSSNTTVIAPN